jgi:type-F conjugative transfer system secretin TraK
MKYIQTRIIALLAGIFFTLLSVASTQTEQKPLTIKLANDNQAAIVLSNKDINRIFVAHDKIVSFNAPNNRLVAHNDQSGSIFLNVTGKETFSVFIATKKGRHFSLLITPKDMSGATVKLVPKTPAITHYRNHTAVAKHFENSSPYEKTLVTLVRDVMLGVTPPGYSQIPPISFRKIAVTRVPRHPKRWRHVSEKVRKAFLGGELAVRVLHVTNHSRHAVVLKASDFYLPGVRAVSIGKERLCAHQSTDVYEVTSNV